MLAGLMSAWMTPAVVCRNSRPDVRSWARLGKCRTSSWWRQSSVIRLIRLERSCRDPDCSAVKTRAELRGVKTVEGDDEGFGGCVAVDVGEGFGLLLEHFVGVSADGHFDGVCQCAGGL